MCYRMQPPRGRWPARSRPWEEWRVLPHLGTWGRSLAGPEWPRAAPPLTREAAALRRGLSRRAVSPWLATSTSYRPECWTTCAATSTRSASGTGCSSVSVSPTFDRDRAHPCSPRPGGACLGRCCFALVSRLKLPVKRGWDWDPGSCSTPTVAACCVLPVCVLIVEL